MVPRDRWDDFALDQYFAALERRLGSYEDALSGLSHFPIDVATAAIEMKHLQESMEETRGEVRRVSEGIETLRDDWRGERDSQRKSRQAVLIAVVTGCFTLLASLIAMVTALVS